jgi:hypothetical protein
MISAPPASRSFCHACRKAASFCICADIVPVANRTKIVIAQHKCERDHPIGTTRIAALGLRNVDIRVVRPDRDGRFGFDPGRLEQPGLLYPGPGAVDLAEVPTGEHPRSLILLDGTWRDVRVLYRHNPWLERIPCYRLNPETPSQYRLRKQPNHRAISTIEATVHALSILEPDTPGIETLTDVFEAMIDRQIVEMRIRSRDQKTSRYQRRRRNRESRSLPEALKGSLDTLVIGAGESVPWQGKKRALIRWYAYRESDGAIFDRFLEPRQNATVTDDHLDLMGLARSDLGRAVDDETFARDWHAFIRPGDTLTTWNQGGLDMLGRLGCLPPAHFALKEAWCNSRGGKCGHLKQLVHEYDIPLPVMPLTGRAARYLSETVGVARHLNRTVS